MITNSEITWVFLALGLVLTFVGRFIVRRLQVQMRTINAYAMLPELAADAVESANRVHLSMGSSALGASGTLSALVSAEVIYRMAQRFAVSRHLPLLTVSEPLTLPLAQDTLRRAYEFRRSTAHFRTSAAAWIPYGPRSLAFAAGAASLAADADVSSTIALGGFGYELALIGESAILNDQDLIAHSNLVEGQAVAYAQADHMLLGEELYVGPAYLGGSALERGGVFALDALRWLVIVGILVIALESAL